MLSRFIVTSVVVAKVMNWWTEKSLRAALEVGNSQELLRLCAQLDRNIELEFRGIKQSVTHHVTRWPVSLQCLSLLIDRFGPNCLTCRNGFGQTPVHLAAAFKDDSWMELIRDSLGQGFFEKKANLGRSIAHFATKNSVSNSSLRWLVKELGSDCLTVPDDEGNTAVHLAAMLQSAALLQFFAGLLGSGMFSLTNNKGEKLADWVEKDSSYRRKSSKRAWIASQKRLSRAPQPQPLPPPTQLTAASSSVRSSQNPRSTPLDPNFTSWSFIYQDGKPHMIGEGGFGKVYKALTDGYQTVAVKIVPLSSESASQKEAIELEKRGVEILKSVRHPKIVLFLKCDLTSDGFCIFTEMVSGLSLCDLMKQQGKPIEESGVRDFSSQICAGLDFLHCQPQGPILHRDIKCSNIMLTYKGAIKLIDFGLAKEIMSKCGLTAGNQVRGTWHFMAPELFIRTKGPLPYSAKTDVWAFGCTVYEMTEMQPPNGNEPMSQIPILMTDKDLKMPLIADRFSLGLRKFYHRCIDRDPEQRATAADLLRHSYLRVSS